ncbi:GNAT family N-acetyltransferase [Crossiella cryophila]|uniref:GNAT superfamily N-acetyltransferase n=1 Tax=Crossiella cryophila TaxID=43355 RepID=A0A7W7CGF7_9PSEU|nr:GNAT family N-acetyltransferase [Crossiella cryophila]MBB4679351.1 GNAT superfamily N-acetyltransferase [Crossiella cryophila]
MTELVGELVRDWVHGWARCREVAPPVAVPEGWRLRVDRPGQLVRHVLPGFDPVRLRELAAGLTTVDTWLKVCGPPDQVTSCLSGQWSVGAPEFLMSLDLAPEPAPETSYPVEIAEGAHVVDVRLRAPDGSVAASGRIGLAGTAVVVDQVETAPAHRRRGLGRVVMASLGAQALARGAHRAVLVATTDGQGLYHALGWTTQSSVTAARRIA